MLTEAGMSKTAAVVAAAVFLALPGCSPAERGWSEYGWTAATPHLVTGESTIAAWEDPMTGGTVTAPYELVRSGRVIRRGTLRNLKWPAVGVDECRIANTRYDSKAGHPVVYLQDLCAGATRVLVERGELLYPYEAQTVSPDAKKVLVNEWGERNRLGVADTASGSLLIVRPGADPLTACWSVDGEAVIFAERDSSANRLRVVRHDVAAGTARILRNLECSPQARASLSPGGRWLCIIEEGALKLQDLRTPPGDTPKQIPGYTPAREPPDFFWSRDGNRLLIVGWRGRLSAEAPAVMYLDVKARSLVRVPFRWAARRTMMLGWLDGGERFAVSVSDGEGHRVWVWSPASS